MHTLSNRTAQPLPSFPASQEDAHTLMDQDSLMDQANQRQGESVSVGAHFAIGREAEDP